MSDDVGYRPRSTEELMDRIHERFVGERPFKSGDDGRSLRMEQGVESPVVVEGERCLSCGGPLEGNPPGCDCLFMLGEFLILMRSELKANEQKGGRLGPEGWKECDPDYLLNEITYHVAKLHGAVRAKRDGLDGADEALKEHTADVANLAAMVADAAGLL